MKTQVTMLSRYGRMRLVFSRYPLETREKSGDSTDVKIQPITGYRITIEVICVI